MEIKKFNELLGGRFRVGQPSGGVPPERGRGRARFGGGGAPLAHAARARAARALRGRGGAAPRVGRAPATARAVHPLRRRAGLRRPVSHAHITNEAVESESLAQVRLFDYWLALLSFTEFMCEIKSYLLR